MSKDPPSVSAPLSKTSTSVSYRSVGAPIPIFGFGAGRETPYRLFFHFPHPFIDNALSSSATDSSTRTTVSSLSSPAKLVYMDYIHPNLFRKPTKRLPRLKIDIDELDLDIVEGLISTADAAVGLAGGYDATTGDLCALAISTPKRILVISFQNATESEASAMLANSILLEPSLKKYAFNAPRLVTSLPAILPSLRAKEVYDLVPEGDYRPHTTSSIFSVLGHGLVDKENVIDVFSSEVCDLEDHKHDFGISSRAWAACHVVNRGGISPTFKIVLPFDTVSLSDEVCHSTLCLTCCG